jgi:hypothetical protein
LCPLRMLNAANLSSSAHWLRDAAWANLHSKRLT